MAERIVTLFKAVFLGRCCIALEVLTKEPSVRADARIAVLRTA